MDDRPQVMTGIRFDSEVSISPMGEADVTAANALILKAFGPGRFAKSAERLREGKSPIKTLSLVAKCGPDLVGCVQTWDIDLVPFREDAPKLCFLGPVAVEDTYRTLGIGAKLISAVLKGAEAQAYDAVVLVGDLAYFSRFGFVQSHALIMPGPVDPNRILIKISALGHPDYHISGRMEAVVRGRVG